MFNPLAKETAGEYVLNNKTSDTVCMHMFIWYCVFVQQIGASSVHDENILWLDERKKKTDV